MNKASIINKDVFREIFNKETGLELSDDLIDRMFVLQEKLVLQQLRNHITMAKCEVLDAQMRNTVTHLQNQLNK